MSPMAKPVLAMTSWAKSSLRPPSSDHISERMTKAPSAVPTTNEPESGLNAIFVTSPRPADGGIPPIVEMDAALRWSRSVRLSKGGGGVVAGGVAAVATSAGLDGIGEPSEEGVPISVGVGRWSNISDALE